LSENHRRALGVAFAHVDGLLSEIETSTSSSCSPFAKLVPDLTPVQAQVLGDYVAQLRAKMVAALEALNIPVPPPSVRASWSIRTSLTFAEVALDDIRPAALRGFGVIEPETAELIERLEADLARTLRRMSVYLVGGQDLAARIARLEAAPAVDIDLLRRLERIITERGLVEYRGALEALLERLESETYEVAVFGRVSSGKSSLLNAILGAALLPVGVTPVTAVPTRIVHGAEPRAVIRLAEGEERVVRVEELPDFVSEAGNPQNHKRVIRATVETPSPALRNCLVLVDTPGVGSLARAGVRETYAYLPRCDLGVLLVDGAGTLDREDLELLRLLDESGIPALVVLSKADLLVEADRRRLLDYLKEQTATQLGLELPVDLVSAFGPAAHLGRDWFEREIGSRAMRGRELARVSAQRKLAALREGVRASLEAMLSASRQRAEATPGLRAKVEAEVLEAEAALRDAGRLSEEGADRARSAAPPVLKAAARRMAELGGAPGPMLVQALVEAAEQLRNEVRAPCLEAARTLTRALAQMATLVPEVPLRPEDLVVDVLSQPTIDCPSALEAIEVRTARWLSRFPSIFEGRAAAKLEAAAGPVVERALSDLGTALRAWSRDALARLGEQFAAQAEPVRSLVRRRESGGVSLDAGALAVDFAELAEHTPSPAAAVSSVGEQAQRRMES
jgi:GTP-binding protein EngB required for normal cell division